MNNERVAVHRLADGFSVDERVAARAVVALFGQAIFEALKAEGGCCEPTNTGAAGVAGGRGRAAGQGRGAVCEVANDSAALRHGSRGAGRPGGGAVLAFVRPAVAAGGL